jgi:hypothetical protein
VLQLRHGGRQGLVVGGVAGRADIHHVVLHLRG